MGKGGWGWGLLYREDGGGPTVEKSEFSDKCITPQLCGGITYPRCKGSTCFAGTERPGAAAAAAAAAWGSVLVSGGQQAQFQHVNNESTGRCFTSCPP